MLGSSPAPVPPGGQAAHPALLSRVLQGTDGKLTQALVLLGTDTPGSVTWTLPCAGQSKDGH